MKRSFLICAVLLLTAAGLARADYLASFKQANQAYEQGRYAEAIAGYEALVNDGQRNAALYYNLGNACYRTHALGRAIACYERAQRLAPRDGDIRQNLAFVRAMVKEPQPTFGETLLSAANNLLSTNELTVLCSVLYLLLVAGIIVHLLRRPRYLLLADIGLLLVVFVLSGWLALKIGAEKERLAVTITGPAEVRNGPGTENSVGFSLPEGRTVVILGETGDWTAVGLRTDGLKGWIEKKYIEEI